MHAAHNNNIPNPAGARYGEVECRQIIPLPRDKPENREIVSRKTSNKCTCAGELRYKCMSEKSVITWIRNFITEKNAEIKQASIHNNRLKNQHKNLKREKPKGNTSKYHKNTK